jgi:nucleotide-binding universal stress UspA family protein
MKKIVMVPLDGSRFAEQALPFAVAVARSAAADLELVRVRPMLPLGLPDDEARQYLHQTGEQLTPAMQGSVRTRVLSQPSEALDYAPPGSGAIASALRRRALEPEVALVVMATHGMGGLKRAWLGSVADALIRMSPRPVLLARPDAEDFSLAAAADRGFHHIVIPLDGSEAAEKVVPIAESFGDGFGARFTLLRVISPVTWQVPTAPYPVPPIFGVPLSEDVAVEYLDGLAAEMRSRGLDVATHVSQGVSPAALIAQYAEEHGADLIAIGTEGAGGVRRFLLGSVADKVVRGSDVPVLVCNVRTVSDEDAPVSAAVESHAR